MSGDGNDDASDGSGDIASSATESADRAAGDAVENVGKPGRSESDGDVKGTSEPKPGTDWRPAVVAAIFSLVGAFAGSLLTYKAAALAAENQYNETFAQTINASLASLRDPKTSGMSFAGLFSLAQSDAQRRAIIVVGMNADTDAIRYTLATFIGSDDRVAVLAHEAALERFIIESVVRSSDAHTAECLPGPQLENCRTIWFFHKNRPSNDSMVSLLQALHPTGTGFTLAVDFELKQIRNGTAFISSTRFVRDEPSMAGHIIGVIPAGTTVRVTGKAQPLMHGNGWLPMQYDPKISLSEQMQNPP